MSKIHPAAINRDGMSNRDYAETNQHFRNCCKTAGIPITKRQAAKFRRGEGTAYANKRKVLEVEAANRRAASMKAVIAEVQSRKPV